jgi:hypothetical protein
MQTLFPTRDINFAIAFSQFLIWLIYMIVAAQFVDGLRYDHEAFSFGSTSQLDVFSQFSFPSRGGYVSTRFDSLHVRENSEFLLVGNFSNTLTCVF